MKEPGRQQQALVATRRSDDRFRRALERLDSLAHRRVANVTAHAGEAAAAVVEQSAAQVEERLRRTLGASAWLLLGLAVGLGVLLGHNSRR